MATTPEEVQQQPKMAQRVIERVTAPVSDHTSRQRTAFAVVAALVTTAPQPFAAVAAVLILVLAYDRKR